MEADMSQAAESQTAPSVRTPPYVAYATFKTLLDDLKTNGVPPQIDKSVLKRFSGGVGNQLLMALKSLGLVTDQNMPTTNLVPMVRDYGTDNYAKQLKLALNHGYPFLGSIDLATATPSMFAEAFRNATGAKEDVLQKCRRFYLQAAQDAGISIGPRIANGGNAAPRANGSPAASAPKRPVRPARRGPPPSKPPAAPTGAAIDIKTQLVGKFPDFDPAWPDDIKAKWFEGFQKLMATATKENGDPQ
jgi:hypothetical protein